MKKKIFLKKELRDFLGCCESRFSTTIKPFNVACDIAYPIACELSEENYYKIAKALSNIDIKFLKEFWDAN